MLPVYNGDMAQPHFSDHTEHIHRIMRAVLHAADPARALRHALPGTLPEEGPLYLVAAGKAALEMAAEAVRLCGERIAAGVVAAVPERVGMVTLPGGIQVCPAAHPLPDERNLLAARAIASIARHAAADPQGVLLALISGGGSAHLTLPVAGLALGDLREISRMLMRAGAPIGELNAVRKHCEVLKGGGLARLAFPTPVHAYLLSDVLGDPLDVIASGPAAPDPTTYADALAVLERYHLLEAVPVVAAHLQAGLRGEHPETLKPGDPVLLQVDHTIIGSNRLALDAAVRCAEELGFVVGGAAYGVEGEASEFGRRLSLEAINLYRAGRPACYLAGGETTVTVAGPGKGGRNQEIVLAAALAVAGWERVAVASFATDGVDGPTDAAGAIATGETAAREMKADGWAFLANNDSYSFFERFGGHIITGPTGTNVNDISLVLVYP
ncbi:MAG: DUF4147 domain-containing protein [Anaerolineae bacterium]|nr:DUF4147 domain-containing protein [Anaerolineae bacterium]